MAENQHIINTCYGRKETLHDITKRVQKSSERKFSLFVFVTRFHVFTEI